MAIVFECISCGGELRTKDEHAGRKAKCRHCGQMVLVPYPDEEAPAPEPEKGETLTLVCPACATRVRVEPEDLAERVICPSPDCGGLIPTDSAALEEPSGGLAGEGQNGRAAPPAVSMTEEVLRTLETLVLSHYPYVYLVSFEEGRWEREIRNLGRRCGREVVTWSITAGPQPAPESDMLGRTALEFLDAIPSYPADRLFVLKDFHPFLTDLLTVRRLRELVDGLAERRQTVFFLGPVLELPRELEKDVTVMELPLPQTDDLAPILRDVLAHQATEGAFPLELSGEQENQVLRSCLGLTEREAAKALGRVFRGQPRMTDAVLTALVAEKRRLIRGSELLEFVEVHEGLKDVGGLENLKDWLLSRAEGFGERARRYNLPQPRGALLLGVQGCGKSLTARATAQLLKFPLLRLDVSAALSGDRGASERNMRNALRVVESVAPAVLWLDEIEKGFAGASDESGAQSSDGTMVRIIGIFLTWLQEHHRPVFVVATANSVTNLPPELLRKGRFDELFFIDLPDADERRTIFEIHLRKQGWDPRRFDLARLAEGANRYSGAEIEQVVLSGMFQAFARRRSLRQIDLDDAEQEIVPLAVTMEEKIDELRNWCRNRARPATRTSAVMEMIAEESSAQRH